MGMRRSIDTLLATCEVAADSQPLGFQQSFLTLRSSFIISYIHSFIHHSFIHSSIHSFVVAPMQPGSKRTGRYGGSIAHRVIFSDPQSCDPCKTMKIANEPINLIVILLIL
jgi:hypothetical protein